MLGVYEPPDVKCKDFGKYVDAALSVKVNRARADEIFLGFVRQIAELWGTVLAMRGQSRGESFVARNVGVRSVWERGQWRVRLCFMDHDALSFPELENGHFYAQNALPGMLLDERHTWGRANPALFPGSLVGCLLSIYRIGAEVEAQGEALAQEVLREAYHKTHQAMLSDERLRAFFSEVFLSRLFDWDKFAAGYLEPTARWEAEMKQMFAEKGYEADTFDY